MSRSAIYEEIRKAHNPDLIKEHAVYSLWSDGEMSTQKGGVLYGWRGIKTMAMWRGNKAIHYDLPQKADENEPNLSYMVATEEDCLRIRHMMYEVAKIPLPWSNSRHTTIVNEVAVKLVADEQGQVDVKMKHWLYEYIWEENSKGEWNTVSEPRDHTPSFAGNKRKVTVYSFTL
jgi:hypothetical protein